MSPSSAYRVSSRSPAARRLAMCVTAFCAALLPARQACAGDSTLAFSSASQIVTSTGMVTSASFTFEAWFRYTGYITENQVLGQYAGGNAGRMILAIHNGKMGFFIGGTWLDGATTVPSNVWTHVAVTRSGTTGQVFLNGALDRSSASFPSTALAQTGISIGNISLLQNGFRGQIADVRAWNLVRTQAEIQSNMYKRLRGDEAGLAHYWALNDGYGSSAANRVAPAPGTITGAAWAYDAQFPIVSTDPVGAWISSAGGAWSVAGNWAASTPAAGVNGTAYFTNALAGSIIVNNDVASQQLGNLVFSGSAAHTLSGNALTLSNDFVVSRVTSLSGTGSRTLSLPLVTTHRGLLLDTAAPGALVVSGALSGPGAVAINAAATGGGSVTLTGANTYTGPTTINSGTLAFSGSSALGAPAPANSALAVGAATLYLTGGTEVLDRGYTVNAPNKAAVVRVEAGADLTIAGRVQTTSGGQVKTGAGTLRLTYPGPNQLSNIGLSDAILNVGAGGDGPSQGFYSFGVADGRVVLGAPGQTNTLGGRLVIGLYTTTAAGAETAGELEIAGGVLNLGGNTLAVGRSNGTSTTAPAGLNSKITVTGGSLTNAGYISLGYNAVLSLAGFNARPSMSLSGGHVHVQNVYLAESSGASSEAHFSGGALDATTTFRLAMASNTVATLTLSGDTVLRTASSVNLEVPYGGTGATGTLRLNGGTLQVRNIVRNGNAGSGTVYFSGGTVRPNASGQTLQNMSAVYVSTNGASVDTSLADYTIQQNLLHDPALGGTDGGLAKSGTGTLTLFGYGSTYTGPTLVSAGTLCVAGLLPPANDVTVASDGELLVGGSATQTVAAASLTLAGSAKLAFAFKLDGASNDRLALSASPALAGKRIALYQLNTRLPFTKNGTYTLLAYSGADPDTTGLSVANAAYGKSYAFSASAGSLTMTISSDAGAASIWAVDASGSWSTAANWTIPPADAAGSSARFDDAITSAATVTTAGETAGALYFNNALGYTLAGDGLTLNGGAAPAAVTVETGSHRLDAPLILSGDAVLDVAPAALLQLGTVNGASSTLTAQGNGTLALTAGPSVQSFLLNVQELSASNSLTVASPITLQRTVTLRPALSTTTTVSSVVSGSSGLTKAGSSTLALSGANTYTGPTTVSAGTLLANSLANGGAASALGASPAAAASLQLGPATFRYTGPAATVNRGYTLAAGSNPVRAATLWTDGDLTLGGACSCSSGAFIKAGPGTLRYTYANGAQTLAVVESAVDNLLNTGVNGDSPTTGFSGFTVSNGKVILGAAGQTNTINVRITVGHYTTTAASAETAGELQLDSGVINCNSTVSIGRGNGTSTTAPGGLTSRLTVNGGLFNMTLLATGYLGGAPAATFNARPAVDLNAGTLNVSTYAQIGESRGAIAAFNVRGGTLRCSGQNGSSGLTLGGPQNPSGTGTLNLSGTGVVDVVHNVLLGTNAGGTGTVHLAGGTLVASNIVKGAGAGYVRFNGGTLTPRVPGRTLSGLTATFVSTNGAIVDTSLADGFTVAQNLLTDPALAGAGDGGLIKLGTNTLSLTGAGNTFNGPVSVRGGLLRARLGATNDLHVAGGAFFDALALPCAVGDLTGYGTLTNGEIALAGALNPGTNGAPAGARMTLQNLRLLGGSTFTCDWSTNSLGQVTNDFATVTAALSVDGPGFVDFGRTPSTPLPVPFTATIMSYASLSGSFAGWRAVNTGRTGSPLPTLIVSAAGGFVKVDVRFSGAVLLLR